MSALEIRAADGRDIEAIVAIFLECWRVSYADVLVDDVLDRMDEISGRELWQRALGLPGETLLAETDGRALGLCRFSASGEAGYLASLYVSPHSQGSGLGSRLLSAAEEGMIAAGARLATLWVFADNAPSIAFYYARGWLPTGVRRVEPEFGAPEAQLAKTLAKTPVAKPGS